MSLIRHLQEKKNKKTNMTADKRMSSVGQCCASQGFQILVSKISAVLRTFRLHENVIVLLWVIVTLRDIESPGVTQGDKRNVVCISSCRTRLKLTITKNAME